MEIFSLDMYIKYPSGFKKTRITVYILYNRQLIPITNGNFVSNGMISRRQSYPPILNGFTESRNGMEYLYSEPKTNLWFVFCCLYSHHIFIQITINYLLGGNYHKKDILCFFSMSRGIDGKFKHDFIDL
jgi:hypothetical protein